MNKSDMFSHSVCVCVIIDHDLSGTYTNVLKISSTNIHFIVYVEKRNTFSQCY